MTTFNTVRDYQELLATDAAPAPYDYGTLFDGDGWLARRRAKRRFKLLKAVDPKLRAILRPEERVFYATSGSTVSLGEQFFVGWVAYYLNRRAMVFTTQRLLLVQIDSRGRARELMSQIPYENIAEVKSTWTGMCQVKLVGGKKYNFQSVPKADRKFLHQFLADVVQPSPASDRTGSIEHLCPHCYTPTPGHPPACPACGGGFKSAKKAALLSLLFPGLGDLYLGHRGFAVMELAGSAFLWLLLVILPLINGSYEDPDTGEIVAVGSEYWIGIALVLAIAHGMDAMMTHHFARKGHHPAKPSIAP